MQSRRDQVQAQSYMLGRLTAALVMAEPEALENPHRRILTGMVAGLLIGGLIMGGFVVFGILKPGGANQWQQPETLIVEKETGGRFVLLDGQLRPVYNYTSAALIFGKRPALVTVSAASLKSVSRGMPIGIVGAPDAPPDPAGLADLEWSVCALAGTDQTGATQTGTLLILTRGGGATPVEDNSGFTVTAPGGRVFLIWNGQRFALTQPWIPRVLGYAAAAPPVSADWLNQLPPGPDITPLDVVGRGEAGPVVDGRPATVGQVFVVRVVGVPDRYFLLLRDGLSPIGATAVALVLGDPDTGKAYAGSPVRPVELTAGGLAQLPVSRQQPLPAGLPQQPPAQAVLPVNQTWCIRRSTPDGPAVVTMQATPTVTVAGDSQNISRTEQTATAVLAAPGVGGLVRQGRAGQAGGTSYFLVTDAGVKFPIGTADAAKALGYSLEQSRTVPAALLSLLPTGPVLDLIPATR
ncbi:type VII secretion protein EccB [Dactylosporangium sp. NPDC048998]|uniref:type VII secretion protein EccB n=1 Tax=Dactylosporangium sp. NPDC048998 TaxID=3363976 RepID=UPI003719EB4A